VYFRIAGVVVLLGTPHAPLLSHCIRIAPFPAGTSEVRSAPVIPSSGVPVSARMRPNDAYFELIADTLDGLESSARAQFLQRFFLSLAHVEVPESKAIALWDDILTRRLQLSDRSDSPIALHTALVDVLLSAGMFQVPVIIEYDALKNLHRNAVTDPLTGLYNRRLFNEYFDKELNRARRYSHPLSLVTLDLHRFKEVNDKHGHPRGDEVLRSAANTLKKALRTSDSAFRIGGDEFALLLPQTDSSQAYGLSRRIGVVFAEVLRPLELTISVSMDHGVSTFPQDGEYRDQLIRIADERLYSAKQATHQKTGAESPSKVSEKAHQDVAVEIPPHVAPEVAPEVAPDIAHEFEPQSVSHAPSAPSLSGVPEVPQDPHAAAPVASTAPAREPEPVVPSPLSAPPVSPLETSRPTFPVAVDEPRIFTVPRKAERVSMAGTNAYAVLGDQSSHRARVVDLGFGGVALDFSSTEGIPDTLLAVLHVPILPPVRVSLKRVWAKQLSEETVRVGCCFIS
jgi:diguanylate cyclase (GGDEF)-like protein